VVEEEVGQYVVVEAEVVVLVELITYPSLYGAATAEPARAARMKEKAACILIACKRLAGGQMDNV